MGDLLERPFDQAITSKYTAMNGLIYLGAGTLVLIWPGMVQTIFRDAAFVGNEAALIRVMGMTVMVIGWLYLFGGLSGGTLGHRGSFSSFSARVCGSRPDARHWRLAASQSIGPPYAIAVALGTAKSSECRYCGQEIRHERSDSAIVPLPLGTATAAHELWRSRTGRICPAVSC
jgi:hypothetical protein